MGGCSVYGCTNSHRRGYRMFRFPSQNQKERREQWRISCKRLDWTPSNNAQVCEVHFEEDQFESKRKDGKKPLKWNAIPNRVPGRVPSPPKLINCERKSKYEICNVPPFKNVENVVTEKLTVNVPNVSYCEWHYADSDEEETNFDTPTELNAAPSELDTAPEESHVDEGVSHSKLSSDSNCHDLLELEDLKAQVRQRKRKFADWKLKLLKRRKKLQQTRNH